MDSSIVSSLVTMVFATAFVLALAWGVLALVRRSRLADRLGGTDKAAELMFVRAMPVGQRERLVVVRYQGAQLLLGVTAGGISLLQRDGPPGALQTPAEAMPGQNRHAPPLPHADPADGPPAPPSVSP